MTKRSRSPAAIRGYRLNRIELWKRAAEAEDASQRAIAERAGVDESALSRLLEGQRSPSLETIIALATAYSCPLEELIVRPDGTPLQIPAQAGMAAAVG